MKSYHKDMRTARASVTGLVFTAAAAADRPLGSSCRGSRLSSPCWWQNPLESQASGSPQSQHPPACAFSTSGRGGRVG